MDAVDSSLRPTGGRQPGGAPRGGGPRRSPRTRCGRRALLVGTGVAFFGTAFSCSLCAYFAVMIARLGSPSGMCRVSASIPKESLAAGVGARPAEGGGAAGGRHSWRIGHPEMYGHVPERTIWTYWYHPVDCVDSTNCTLPPVVQLCHESIERNKGGFDYKIMHWDEIDRYVNRMELPIHFSTIRPAQQKDALMNALLARYGGVALDITTILLRPLDEYWDEMVARRATFRGYMYRLHGMQWGNSESMVVWFLMTRREGIFSTAVMSGLIGMGDHVLVPSKPKGYHNPYFAFGDQSLTPVLSMFNYSLPKCRDDPTVGPPVSWSDMCPEYEFPAWDNDMPGPPRNDASIMLREPREGPQLPFAFLDDFSMGMWHINSSSRVNSGIPPRCDTQQECWRKVFLERYHRKPAPGRTRVMTFVKLFGSAGRLKGFTRSQLLADPNMYFYNWLNMAGLDVASPDFKTKIAANS